LEIASCCNKDTSSAPVLTVFSVDGIFGAEPSRQANFTITMTGCQPGFTRTHNIWLAFVYQLLKLNFLGADGLTVYA